MNIILFQGSYDGYCIEMMEKIEKLLNFSCEYYQVSQYGQLEEKSGNWSGMMRELVAGRSDIALGGQSVRVREKSDQLRIYFSSECDV